MTQFKLQRPARRAHLGAWSELFDDLWRDAGSAPTGARVVQRRGVYPPVNLHETEEAFVLTAELPGIAPEEIDVSLEGSTVTLSGQRKIEHVAGDGVAVHRRERQSGHFKRAFDLPTRFNVGEAEASHRAGVLTIRLPKSSDAKPRQIEIQTR